MNALKTVRGSNVMAIGPIAMLGQYISQWPMQDYFLYILIRALSHPVLDMPRDAVNFTVSTHSADVPIGCLVITGRSTV